MSRYPLITVGCGIVVVALICAGFAYAIGASQTASIDEAQISKQESSASARAKSQKAAFNAARTSAAKQGRAEGRKSGRRNGSKKGQQAGDAERTAQAAAAEQEQAVQYPPSFYQRPCPPGLSYSPAVPELGLPGGCTGLGPGDSE